MRPEINTAAARATTPIHIIKHIENLLRKPASSRHDLRLDFQDKHLPNLTLLRGIPHLLVEVFDDDESVDPDDYNLATIKAVDLPYTTDFDQQTAPAILSEVLAEQRGTTLIGVPIEALWNLDRSLHPQGRQTATQQLLGAMAIYSHSTR